MTNKNDDELDRELDAALARYWVVEPRPGLEERVLANLRNAPAEVPRRAWWRWSLAAAVAAIVVVALALAWRSNKTSRPVVASHPSTTEGTPELGTQVGSNALGNGARQHGPHPPRKIGSSRAPVVVAAVPKLDQFPSPQPLTEEERILADYVRHFQDQAVQIARVANAEVQRDRMEVIGPPQAVPDVTEHESMMSR